MTCQPGNLSTNHLNATISGNDFSCPVMLLEDHGRYMRRFSDCIFPSLFGLCRLAIYPAIAFTAQPQRTGNRMRFTVNIGAHFCGRELFFIWLMLPLSGGVIEKCAAADKDTKKSWAAIVKPLPASLYPGRTGVRPHASPVPESSMLQWPPVLTTSKTHAEVPSRQQESSEATVRTHPQRRPDRKRQYYRNPSAERFDQQIEALANEVNRLKKQLHGPHRESHKTALLDLAFQITERDPHPLRASPRALALLANAFSKLAKYQEGATALDWIMKAVIHRSQKQQLTKQCGFKAQTLAMVLNSLSQVAGDDADTTRKALAKEVGRRDLTDPREWSAQHLAMVTNGLSQVTGDDADTTRKALAKEVGRRALAGDLKCWIAQDLAMVTNGLSPVTGDDADTTRKALAKEVGRRDLTAPWEWSAQPLAMVTNGLSQVTGDDADTTRKALAKEVGSRDLTDTKEWSAQHLAMVTNGLSQVAGDDADTTRKALAKEVGRRALAGDLKYWIAQHLALLTNSLRQVAGDDADTTRKALAKEVGSRDLNDTKEWSAQHLAMVTNGLSPVTGDNADTTRKALAKEVGRRGLAGDLKCWIAQDLAMVTNGLSQVTGDDDADTTRKALAKEVGRRALAGDLKCWIAQHLAMVTNGLSQVTGDDADTTRKALAKEVGRRALAGNLKCWIAQNLAMVTNGLSQVTGDDADTTRKALAKEVGRRALAGDLKCWIAQELAMVTNGLSQVTGDDADTTRKALAKEVGRRDLTAPWEWSAQPLAMVTNGLRQVMGDDADTTRKALAKEVGRRALAGDLKCWIAQELAMVTNGLSQVTGDDADTTRKALAKEVGRRDLTDPREWSAQHLAMVTNGLSPVAGDDADTTRKALAKEVGSRDLTDTKEWSAQPLAMVTNGLSQVTGDDADTTRKALAKEVGSRDLTDTREWTAQPLAMVASGMSHCSHVIGEDVVQASIQAIMNISPTEQEIIMALYALCRLSLSDDQLKLGYFLVKRLCDMTGFIDTGGPLQQSVGDFLWNLAVLDLCAKQNPLVKDDPDTPRFDIFVKPLMDMENIRDVLSHHWQDRFAYIYWAGISNLEIDVSPALSAPEKKVKVSALQNRVFQAVKNALPNQNIVMEVNIEGFPVDILVGKTLCIEVDGPHHYIQDDTMENDELLAKESGKRRARDRLIDHMLKGLGFEVLRISYVETDSVAGLGTFVDRVINAMDEQEMSSQYEGLRVNDLPAW